MKSMLSMIVLTVSTSVTPMIGATANGVSEHSEVRQQPTSGKNAPVKLAVREHVEFAQAEKGRALAHAGDLLELAQAAGAGGRLGMGSGPSGMGTPQGLALPHAGLRLANVVGRNSSRALVVRTSEPDPKVQSEIEEDVNVMTRILDKKLSERFEGDRGVRASGIDLLLTGGSAPIRSLYLEGYGALFTLQVNFPLLEESEGDAQEKPKGETDSTWESARRELYGGGAGGGVFDRGFGLGGFFGTVMESGQAYDADKVSELEETLLEVLKNAHHIRGLEPTDSVTLCVFGGSAPRTTKVRQIRSRTDEMVVGSKEVTVIGRRADGSDLRGSMLTMRVKKSDVDAFARGELDLAGFRERASIEIHRRNLEGEAGPFGVLEVD
jgi:hypothetical protein